MVFLVMEKSAEKIEEKKKTDIEKLEKLRENIGKLRERKTKNTRKINEQQYFCALQDIWSTVMIHQSPIYINVQIII